MPKLQRRPPLPQQPSTALRGPLTLALTVLGSAALLLVGRQLLHHRPLPSPDTPAAVLERTRRWDPAPERRREAALLLLAGAGGVPVRQRQLLRAQGWGTAPLAPVALKRDALAAETLGRNDQARDLWRQLERRFPDAPPSADALYALGREEPPLRLALLRRFPAHPAALAAAVEQGPAERERLTGALHLARWGPRWPGAEPLLRQACQRGRATLGTAERAQLASGLARLGDGAGAALCLGPATADAATDAATELAIGDAQLRGTGEQQRQGERRLLDLAQRWPRSPEAQDAVRALSHQTDAPALLAQLPSTLVDTAPVQARLARQNGGDGWRSVLGRWPLDPASWELQWELARQRLLEGEWAAAATLLAALPPERLPAPLAARQLFWLGFAREARGESGAARQSWERLLARHPWGYYAWRARWRLGQPGANLRLRAGGAGDRPPSATTAAPGAPAAPPVPAWQPLASGDADLDRLWRLGLPLEAWEQWRQERPAVTTTQPDRLVVEGRLRQGVGDDWTGLGQLELASLRWLGGSCRATLPLERALHPHRHGAVFAAAAAAAGLDPSLLLAVAKQESRFTPSVGSGAGAIGLLQLLPSTASELAGAPVTAEELRQPERNAPLGARYLRQMLDLWRGNPFAAVASYNAGPGAVAGWIDPRLGPTPELWVEAIPYPETRLYVKKVLGNLWSYQQPPQGDC